MAELWRPFTFEFFRNGLIVATVAGALCGLIGVFVVLKGMSYIGHGLSHAIFGGFAASSLLGVNVLLGAGVWGVASALMINGVTRRRVIGADAAIGVITTASFALGLTLFAAFGRRGRNFDAALFGSILGVGWSDVAAVLTVAAGQVHTARQVGQALVQQPAHQRLERIELQLTGFGCHGDGYVVADDFKAHLVHHFRDHRIDLARHDGRAGLACGQAGVWTPVRNLGVPQQFIPAGTRAEILEDLGLTPAGVARSVVEIALDRAVVRLSAPAPQEPRPSHVTKADTEGR